MSKNLSFLMSLCLVFALSTYAQEYEVKDINEYKQAIQKVQSGGTVILKNGIWKDVELKAFGNGTENNPVIVRAETPGKVIISGNSNLSIYGNHVIVSGLWFKDGYTSKSHVVQFRKNSKEFAYNCRFTNSTISYFGVSEDVDNTKWVSLYGKKNRVDHNNFTGKRSAGTTLVVWLSNEECLENEHRIDHNLFGPRPELGMNGGETIRIGTSKYSMESSKTIVESNLFRQCNGEIEIISNKSGDNIFRNNLFYESEGALTLRHGNNALVENNVFLGNNKSKTAGIRMTGENHIIRNNLFIALRGTNYRSPITMMTGVPNSPLNRYYQVKNVSVLNNTIINSEPIMLGAGKDDEKTLPPINCLIANNLFTSSMDSKIYEYEGDISSITFENNFVNSATETGLAGFIGETIEFEMINSLPIPSTTNDVLKKVNVYDNSPKKDITETPFSDYVAGAFNLGTKKVPKALLSKTGPGWTPNIVAPPIIPESFEVQPGVGTLRKALRKSGKGDTLKLKPGVYSFDKSVRLAKDAVILGDENGGTILNLANTIEKDFIYFIRINQGNSLHIKNITFNAGNSNMIKYGITSPSKMEPEPYEIIAENCNFIGFTNPDAGCAFRTYRGTMAKKIKFKNCKIIDAHRGLNIDHDSDISGSFTALKVIIENSVFKDIKEYAISYKRNTISVDIKGGDLHIKNSVFENVFNEEDGRVIRSDGLHKVKIEHSAFLDSYRIKKPLRLKGKNNSIENCLFYAIGFPETRDGAKQKDIISKKPKWDNKENYIPSDKSPLLESNNGVGRIGLIN